MASAQAKIPLCSAVRKLCQHGEAALRPQFVNGRWRGAAVKARAAARIRKEAIVNGTYGSFDQSTGVGWDPSWDRPGKIGTSIRAPKETKRERTREARAAKIENLVESMDDKVAEYRQSVIENKPDYTKIENVVKRMMRGGKKK